MIALVKLIEEPERRRVAEPLGIYCQTGKREECNHTGEYQQCYDARSLICEYSGKGT